MSAKALVIWIVAVAAFIGLTLAMRGDGHRSLAKWMASVHGGSR